MTHDSHSYHDGDALFSCVGFFAAEPFDEVAIPVRRRC
jgi:hypothetical protein